MSSVSLLLKSFKAFMIIVMESLNALDDCLSVSDKENLSNVAQSHNLMKSTKCNFRRDASIKSNINSN